VTQVQAEAQEHFRALLGSLQAIQNSAGGAGAAAPEEAANVMVHNRAILRNKRLLLAYVCVSCCGPGPGAWSQRVWRGTCKRRVLCL
jgi:hypothetical protein